MAMEKGEALLGVAMEAWKKAGKGVNADFKGHRVVKSDKIILIMPRLGEWPLNSMHKSGGLSVVAYPRPEHVEAFKEANSSVATYGPAYNYPGSIGSLELQIWSRNHPLELRVAQSHFKAGNNHYLYVGQTTLPRSLATKYHGWRKRALKHAVEIAHRHDKDFEVSRETVNRGKKRGAPSALERELAEIAAERNTELYKLRRVFQIKRRK